MRPPGRVKGEYRRAQPEGSPMSWFRRSAAANTVRSVSYASSPLLASKTPPWRSKFLVALLGLGSCVLIGRAAYVQVIDAEFYLAQGATRYATKETLPAMRGRIVDRNGQLLAVSVATTSVQVEPKSFKADAAQRKALARLAGMPLAEFERRVRDSRRPFWLLRDVDDGVWLQAKAVGAKGVTHRREYKRKYPEGEAAAHVVGFTDVDQRGLEGVELAFQDQLIGTHGVRRLVQDRMGRAVEDIELPVEPRHGSDITLSLDAKIQSFAYQKVRDAVVQHKAAAGSAVVIDARTGEILALANYPSFNPSDRRNLSGAQLRNRALTDTFEPGSTMKPFIAARAIDSGRVSARTPIQTAPGWMTITGSTIRDAHPHGVLTVSEVIQKSSNVGTVKLAMQMPAREMWELYSQVGFGQKPQISFPGAVTGRLRPYKSWRPIEQATMSYGYGLSASLLQLARAYTVFAHDGEVIPMTMMKQDGPPAGIRVFSPATARQMRDMLQLAAGPGGTAPKARAVGYSVGGKTGTARKQVGKSYASDKYRAWFVGLAPVSDPRLIVAVMIDEPNNGVFYGGEVAAPVFSQVVQQGLRTLGVAPDVPVASEINLAPVAAETESF